MTELIRRINYLLHRRRFDQELASEMETHREMAATEGRKIGNTLRLREEARDAWGWTWLDNTAQDLRYAARMLRRSPGFTLAGVLTLAVGIGVNIAAFGFFDLFALRPLPIRDPHSILRFQRRSPQSFATHLSYPSIAFYREHSRSLSAVLAQTEGKLALEGQDKPIRSQFVTANYLTDLGAQAALGRIFDSSEDSNHGEPAVVLSHAFWQSHFGGDPAILGKTIRLNQKPAIVAGVTSREFSGLSSDKTDAWLPIVRQPYFIEGSRLLTSFSEDSVSMWGRLQPGSTPKLVEEELRTLTAELRKQNPTDVWENEYLIGEAGGYIRGAQGRMSKGNGSGSDDLRTPYALLALVGGLVFLILAVACGNLGSLLLARGVVREREIAIRLSVGAGRGRLIRQLFTESLLLAFLGSAAGLALGYIALRVLLTAAEAPPWLDPTPDWRVILFAIGIGFIAAILFGLSPALQIARQRQRATVLRQVLIAGQVTASCVLLITSALLVKALDRALHQHPGFEYKNVLSIDPNLGAHGYSPEKARAHFDVLSDRLKALPGIDSVSIASHPPLGRKRTTSVNNINGYVMNIHFNHVDSEFFRTMTIPILRGRTLLRTDAQALVISESLAHRRWPGEDPLGKEFEINAVKFHIVGVSGNARAMALQDPDAVEVYQLAETANLPSSSLLVKTSGSPKSSAALVSSIAKAIDPTVNPQIELMQNAFDRGLRSAKGSALAVSLMGLIALLLACLGIVGLVAYSVSHRTKEIGIRMALGAQSTNVLSGVLRQFSRPVALGLLVGVAGAAALSQVIRRELYGVSNLDPMAYLAAIGIFVGMASIAAIVPARRALRIDPMKALRYE